jgi:hypothetical protein
VGDIVGTALIGNIQRARTALAEAVETGPFTPDQTVQFEFVTHFATVDECAGISAGNRLNQRA